MKLTGRDEMSLREALSGHESTAIELEDGSEFAITHTLGVVSLFDIATQQTLGQWKHAPVHQMLHEACDLIENGQPNPKEGVA